MSDAVISALSSGFVALVVAGLSNFGAESYKRHRDKRALAAALAGELTTYLDAFAATNRVWEPLRLRALAGERLRVPKSPRPKSPVFESVVASLGALGPALAEDVTYVYATVEAFRDLMASVVSDDATAESQAAAIGAGLQAAGRVRVRATRLVADLRTAAAAEYLAPGA